MSRTEVIKNDDIDAIITSDPSKLASKVIIHCKDGRILEKQVDYPKGDPPNPMTWDESVEKFMSLAAPVYGKDRSVKLCHLVDSLEESTDFSIDFKECLV